MANISLKSMLEASINPKLVARSKKTGKLVYFKSPEAKANALKAGSHEEPKKDKKAQAKQAAQSADMFKGDYSKERELPTDDFSDIKGPNPNKPGWSTEDVFNATFKDPETGKTITVGDAYDREDGSPAYEKAFAYASQFDPDDEELISGPGSSKADLPKKASELSYEHSSDIQNMLDSNSGLKGLAQMNDNGAIEYTASSGEEPTYGLFIGPNDDYGKPDEFRVSLESIYGNDPSNLSGKNDKSFKSAKDAMVYMTALAKKYQKELQMDDGKNESTKLTSMIKK